LLLTLPAGGLALRTGPFLLLSDLLLPSTSLRHETLEAFPHLLLVLPRSARCLGPCIVWRYCRFPGGSLFDHLSVLLHPLLYGGLGCGL